MPKEGEPSGVPLKAIHINLTDRSIEFESEQGTVAKLTFGKEGIIFNAAALELSTPSEALQSPSQEDQGKQEKEATITLTGRLKNKPKQGRADRSGNPTAYARFAAHIGDEEGPHDYIATFHRHTARIALGLPRDAQVTVEGYPHPSGSEKRLDTFSVINLVWYPGKLPK